MLTENMLKKLALICSVVGIIALFIISKYIEIDDFSSKSLTTKDIGKEIKLEGNILKIKDSEKIAIITLNNNKTVVVFKDSDTHFYVGQTIKVYGNVEEFNGEPQIIAYEIMG